MPHRGAPTPHAGPSRTERKALDRLPESVNVDPDKRAAAMAIIRRAKRLDPDR